MPLYDFICINEECGNEEKDVLLSHCAEDPIYCVKCGEASLQKQFPQTAPPQFRGSGFYETDYKKKY